MVRVKNWASCIPEDLRQSDFMNVVMYERQLDPQPYPSPFHRRITGPGFFASPRPAPSGPAPPDEEAEYVARPPAPTPPRAVVNMPGTRLVPPTATRPVVSPAPMTAVPRAQTQMPAGVGGGVRSVVALMGGPQALEQNALREPLHADTGESYERERSISLGKMWPCMVVMWRLLRFGLMSSTPIRTRFSIAGPLVLWSSLAALLHSDIASSDPLTGIPRLSCQEAQRRDHHP